MSELRRGGVRDLIVRARREQIVEAATRIFAEKGFRCATIREVARSAGISEGTIYSYVENKDALLRRFPRGRLAVASETLRWRRGLFLRGLERLPLVMR